MRLDEGRCDARVDTVWQVFTHGVWRETAAGEERRAQLIDEVLAAASVRRRSELDFR